MIDAMEKFPEAAFGISRPDDDLKPYPYILDPKESIKIHFEKSLFTNAPTSTIIRKDIFNKVNGFSGTQYIGDTELWLKIGSKYPVVIFVRGLTWWRGHDDQQIKQEEHKIEPIINRYNLAVNTITNFNYFTLTQKQNYLKKEKKNLARRLLSITLRKKEINTLLTVKKATDLNIKFFFSALFKRN
jgi:hypothetical protein